MWRHQVTSVHVVSCFFKYSTFESTLITFLYQTFQNLPLKILTLPLLPYSLSGKFPSWHFFCLCTLPFPSQLKLKQNTNVTSHVHVWIFLLILKCQWFFLICLDLVIEHSTMMFCVSLSAPFLLLSRSLSHSLLFSLDGF